MGSALDAEGNILLTGTFRGTILPAPHTLTAGFNDHYFLAKFDREGEVLWAQQFGLAGSPGYDIDVAVHPDSNTIVLAGNLLEDTDFGGGALPAPTNGNWGMFVASFDSDGSHRWSKSFGSSADLQQMHVVATAGGKAIISGMFLGAANLGGSTFTSTASYDAFLVGLDISDGSHRWSRSIGDVIGSGSQDQYITALATSSGHAIVIGGAFTTSLALGGTHSLTHQGPSAYLARLDEYSGSPSWSRKLPGSSILAAATDNAGNSFITGYIDAPVDFGGGSILEPSGNKDVFAAKYGQSGTHHWSKHFGQFNDNQGLQVGVGPEDNVVLAGTASGTINFGGAPLTGQPPSDIFIAKFGALGAHQWSHLYGNASAETPHTMNVDALSGEVVIAGRTESAINIGVQPIEQGMFIMKLAR
ncbi:hypothetical protein [Chondromyces apiculatus]|nr:hypothetical protein [Chondromyces apiculatus]